MNKKMFTTINVSFKYKFSKEWLFQDLNLEIEEGIWVLAGPNGSGKTTFIKLLLGVLKPNTGKIYIYNKEIKSPEDTRNHIIYLPTNVKNYLIGPRVRDEFDKVEEKDIVKELLKSRNIVFEENKPIYHLSEGQMRILANLTAIFTNKKIVILDEPTIGLDKKFREVLLEAIRTKMGEKNFLVATNDPRLMIEIEKMLYFKGNGIIAKGNTKDLIYGLEKLRNLIPTVKFSLKIGLEGIKPVSKRDIIPLLRREKLCQASS